MPIQPRAMLLTLSLLLSITPQIQVEAQSPYKDVDPQGFFYPLDVPNPLGNITYVEFNHSDIGDPPLYELREVPLRGGVLASRNRFFKFASVKLTGLDVEFTTIAIRGTRYSFTGKFLRHGRLSESESDQQCVLKGQLTLHRGAGKQTSNVCFWYFQGD